MVNLPPKIRWAVFIGIALLALVIRLPDLDERPMHTDEAVNGYITGQLLAGETYQYDPQDRHGPALYLATLPIVRLAGADKLSSLTETAVRLVPVVFSVLTILLVAAAVSHISFTGAVLAALLLAVSPLPIYYSRYFIHETLFVAATFALLLSGWRMLEHKSTKAALAAGASAGLMLACKETALIHFAALIPAGLWWMAVRRSDVTHRGLRWSSLIRIGSLAVATFLLVTVALYTWGGQHWQGPLDLLRSIPRFAARAGGEGHEKPFWYYLGLLGLGWSGIPFLIFALLGSIQVLRTAVQGLKIPSAQTSMIVWRQLLLVYTLAVTFVYSAIPYKNPWLALNLWLPLALLAGLGFASLWDRFRKFPSRLMLIIAALLLLTASARDTGRWVFAKPSDENNPYAYAHTVEDILGIPDRLSQIAAENRLPADFKIAVIAADPWPLPWYLRKFPQVGFYQPSDDPGSAAFYITSLEATEIVEERLTNWRYEFFGVRPEVLVLLWSPPVTDRHE